MSRFHFSILFLKRKNFNYHYSVCWIFWRGYTKKIQLKWIMIKLRDFYSTYKPKL